MFVDFLIQQKRIDKRPDRIVEEEIGVYNTALSFWRRGYQHPGMKSFNKVMKYYDVDKDYAIAMWKDIKTNAASRRVHHIDTFGEHVIDDEFYKIEKELIDKYNGFKNVPESDEKLKRMRKLVGQ